MVVYESHKQVRVALCLAIGLLLLAAIQGDEEKIGVEGSVLVRPVRMLRDPMPWEGEYFDPSYHRWPKSESGSKKFTDDSKAKRFISDSTMFGGLY